MRSSALRLLLATLALVLLAVPAGAQDDETQSGPLQIESVKVTGYPSVSIAVSAPASADPAGFSAADFSVTEDGEPVSVDAERMESSELHVMLVIDTSGSMDGEPLQAAKSAVAEFLAALPAEVHVGAVSFGPTATLLSAPTTDRGALASSIEALFVSGETALYDAVIFAASQFEDDVSDRAIVVLSDGGDTASSATLDEATASVSETRADVVELATAESNREALDAIAMAGNGSVSSTDDPDALADLYRVVAAMLANRYELNYTSTGAGDVTLSVSLDVPGLGEVGDEATIALPAAEPPVPSSISSDDEATQDETSAPALSEPGDPPTAALLAGGAAAFGALLLLGLIALSRDPDRQLARAGLGLKRPSIDRATATRVKDRLATDVDRFLDRSGGRGKLESMLDVAGIALRPGEFLLMAGLGTLVGVLVLLALLGLVGALVALVLGPLLARTYLVRRVRTRREAFADSLPGNLQLMTNALRSGYGMLQALDAVASEASEPARTEFRRVILETRVGRDLRDAMTALAERMNSRDFDWVVGAIEINRDVGGDLAGVLDTVAETIRERQRVHRQIRTLTAEGRISVVVLTALPPGLAALMAAFSPDYFDELTTGAGLIAVIVGAVMLVLGWVWMSRMVRIEY